MPQKDMFKIYDHINFYKHSRCANNPIKYFYQYKKAPSVVHYVCPLHELQILPPCKRLPDQLPHQWKEFNYPTVVSKTSGLCIILFLWGSIIFTTIYFKYV